MTGDEVISGLIPETLPGFDNCRFLQDVVKMEVHVYLGWSLPFLVGD